MIAGVSVIVCCYNSEFRLLQTLSHLKNQKTKDISFEIIVVDNASTDATKACAQKILDQVPLVDFTIVDEPISGLSFARKKGYSVAKFDFLLYCDDDNWLSENYVQVAYETMMANHRIGILGGLGTAVFESQEPTWFKKYEIDFAVGEQSTNLETLSLVPAVYGAGFTIRKAYLDKLFNSGFQSILSDRKGDLLVSGGDVELCIMAKYFGYEIWYNRNLRFEHLMTTARLNWNYMKKLYMGNGKTNVYIHAYSYIEKTGAVPGLNLRFPLWLDTLIHKTTALIRYYPKVKGKFNLVGEPEVLRFIAMKSEAKEIGLLKNDYLKLYQSINEYLSKLRGNKNEFLY